MSKVAEGENRGRLYGVGVGCGDPRWISLEAVQCIRDAAVVVLPASPARDCHAYKIASQAVDLEGKEILCRPFPMIKDRHRLDLFYDQVFGELAQSLDKGLDVAFLTIGDPAVYATYNYMHQRALAAGYTARMVSGIPSFCSVAAALGLSLGDNAQPIHILPGAYQSQEEGGFASAWWPGTKVYMKSGRQLEALLDFLREKSREEELDIYAVSQCGQPEQRIFRSLEEIDAGAGYLTTVIVKPAGQK